MYIKEVHIIPYFYSFIEVINFTIKTGKKNSLTSKRISWFFCGAQSFEKFSDFILTANY